MLLHGEASPARTPAGNYFVPDRTLGVFRDADLLPELLRLCSGTRSPGDTRGIGREDGFVSKW